MPSVSVIIPTYNAEVYIQKLCESLVSQSLKNIELIIIDSSSTDKTREIAKQYTSNIIQIPQEEFDHGSTRTKAAKIAKGDILVYLTQDAIPYDRESIAKIIEAFENPKVGAAYGRQIPYEKTNIFGKHLREFNYPENSYIRSKNDIKQYGIKTAFLSDSFAAYRKETLSAVSFFKDKLILGEDTYVGAKMILEDHLLAYVAQAKVYHSHSYSIKEEFKRYFDIGVFHKSEEWLLKTFGKAENEGLHYVKSEINYLSEHKKNILFPELIVRNFTKYFAYKLGQKHSFLPKKLIIKLSMHNRWWHNF